MAVIVGPPANATRCRSITAELRELLNEAADANGIDKIVINSGGQPSNHAPHLKNVPCGWTGSRRHDNGRAADIQLVRNGSTLTFTDTNGSQVSPFLTACAARGATGIGAGVGYMGPKTMHIGFGTKAVWGKDGLSVNAPPWLRTAVNAGWNNPVAGFAPMISTQSPSRSVVIARRGLYLRAAADLTANRLDELTAGTEVSVLGFEGAWARVDMQGDGLMDGLVYAAYLKPADGGGIDDAENGEEERVDDEALADLLRDDGERVAGSDADASRSRSSAGRRRNVNE
jgi:hypothetical protein